MSTSERQSDSDLGSLIEATGTASSASAGGTVWLEGETPACRCPACGSPMTLRLGLLRADCWRCGASVEVSVAQEQEALRLLRAYERQRRSEARAAADSIRPTVARARGDTPAVPPPPPASRAQSADFISPERVAAVPPPPPSTTVPAARSTARQRLRAIAERGALAVYLRELLGDLPAWLISLVFHIVLMLLLAIWYDEPKEQPEITLSSWTTEADLPGELGEVALIETEPLDPAEGPEMEIVKELLQPASGEEIVELRDESAAAAPSYDPLDALPPAESLGQSLASVAPGRMFQGRDPEARSQLVHQAGGTSLSEAAVTRGLQWLARVQNEDGSWSLERFGGGHAPSAATALALLPFLGAGQTHLAGDYRDTVFRGLKWLIEHQRENGDLRGGGIGRMYAHGQSAIALCEAYGLSGDEQLREPAQLALNFIVAAQHADGGWRYEPGEAGDTSVVGWQLMALQSGRMSYLHVPQETLDRASRFLDRVQRDRYGGRYSYMPGGQATNVMTAEALLCRQYLGWVKDHAGLQDGAAFLAREHPPRRDEVDIYYWYYASQVLHHLGGRRWDEWNRRMRDLLVSLQETEGENAGSWLAQGPHAGQGGRIYMTALALCTLEIYYRHLPLYGTEALLEPAAK